MSRGDSHEPLPSLVAKVVGERGVFAAGRRLSLGVAAPPPLVGVCRVHAAENGPGLLLNQVFDGPRLLFRNLRLRSRVEGPSEVIVGVDSERRDEQRLPGDQ